MTLRIGVVAAVACGGLAVTAAPAFADPPTVTIERLSTNLDAGESTTLRYAVENNIANGGPQVQIRVNISGNALACSGDCGSLETIANRDTFNATLRASNNLPPGSNQNVTISITAQNADGTSQAATAQLNVRGPEAPDTIRSLSGRVVNVQNGRGISNATVALNDAKGRTYDTRTDGDGDFKFTSSDSKPIAPGQILLAAGKEGFENNDTSTTVGPGQAKTGVRITLKSNAPPSKSASPTPPVEESLESTPAEEASSEEAIDAAPAAGDQNSDSGGGLFSWMLIILGGLLVALGVGAIVLLVIRRKDGGEDDTGDPLPGPNGPRPTPGAHGVYRPGPEPTMVTGGAAMGGGPTMAMRPGLADAPTMMHQPVDEYGDPYGTPLRAPQPASGPPPGMTQPGMAQPGYGYPGANQGGYGPGGSPVAPPATPGSPGAPTAYGSASPTAYGGATGRASASASPPDPYAPRDRDYDAPAQGGYGYDEPTGRYEPNGGYGQAAGGYGAARGGGYGSGGPANGYDGGYGPGQGPGQGPGPSNGYGRQDNGYGRQDNGYAPGAGGGYDAPGGYDGGRYQTSPASGYGPQGGGYEGYGQQPGGHPGYEQGGYDQPAGYDRIPEPRSGGYDQQQRGYDQQGYHDEPTTRGDRGNGKPPRRSLDWLDD